MMFSSFEDVLIFTTINLDLLLFVVVSVLFQFDSIIQSYFCLIFALIVVYVPFKHELVFGFISTCFWFDLALNFSLKILFNGGEFQN